MNTTGYAYADSPTYYSRESENYEEGNSQSPPTTNRNHNSSNQSPQQTTQLDSKIEMNSDFDYDEESQYSLSEFSHIHLVDGEAEHSNHFNRALSNLVHPNNSSSLSVSDSNGTAANVSHTTSTSSFNGGNTSGAQLPEVNFKNYLESHGLSTSNRKRAFSFAASTEDTIISSSPPLNVNASSRQLTPNNLASVVAATTAAMAAVVNNNNGIINNNNNCMADINNGSPTGDKQRTATKICRVCGDKAYSYNFNVITCESCKAFFRRNANKEKEIRCPFNEQCDINMVSRRFCQRCRLQKCFRVGMKKEWIMTEEARLEKKQRIQDNRQRRLAERKKRSGSAEALKNSAKTSNLATVSNSSAAAPANVSNDTTPPAEKFMNIDSSVVTDTRSSPLNSQISQEQLLREQQQSTSILIDTTQNLSTPVPLPASINKANLENKSSLVDENIVLSPTIPLLPALINSARRPSTDVIAAAVNNNVIQLSATSTAHKEQQSLENLAQNIATQQQQPQQQQLQQQLQQLEQITQSIQQQQRSQEQKVEPMDHEPSAMSQQQILGNSGKSTQNQLEQTSHSFCVQTQQHMEQLPIIGGGNNATSITATTTMCPTFCTSNVNPPAANVSHSDQSSNSSTLIPPTEANMATAAAVAAAAAAQQPAIVLNCAQPQPAQTNFAAAVQAVQLQNLGQQHILQQQAAAQIQQQIQNQQIISQHAQQQQQHQIVQQQQLLAAQQQQQKQQAVAAIQQMQQQQIVAAVAAASCLQQTQPMTTAVDIAAAAMAATQSTQSVNQPKQTIVPQPASQIGNTGSFVAQTFLDPATAAATAAAAAAAAGMIPQTIAIVPPPPSALAATIPPLQQQQNQQQQTSLQNSLIPQLIESATSAAVAAASAHQQNSQEMVAVPKDVLIKLVEHKIESDQQQQQTEAKPAKCQCRCQCGRYPNEMLIVDKVMTDLLENSSKQCGESGRRNSTFPCSEHSNSTTPNNLNSFMGASNQPSSMSSSFYQSSPSVMNLQQPNSNSNSVNFDIGATLNSDAEINADYCNLALGDEDNLNELLRANGVWNSQPGEIQYGVTESGLRRLIKTINSIATFRSLDHNDQTLLLKHGCESYFALRGITSYEESKIPALIQNGVSENIIGFYKDFPQEWKSNETIILLLGMILLFNPDIPELNNRIMITMESLKYQSIMKRVLYALCCQNTQTAAKTFSSLLGKLDQLKAIATICALDSVEPIVQQMFEPSPPISIR